MIERYTLPEMGAIWSDENKFRTWLEIIGESRYGIQRGHRGKAVMR